MKLLNKAVACGLAVTLVATCNGPADTALAEKKVSLSKKTVKVTVGQAATVKVKNASKTVKWSSNKKKIATVSASGKKKATAKIKGIAAGKATITAKVGKKKLTCNVTVKNTVSKVKSVTVDPLDTSCVVLTMKKKTAVNVSDLVVAKKNYKEGTYNYKPTIKTIASADQITYRIYLDSSISKGDWLKVTYKKTDSVEQQYINKVFGISTNKYVQKGKLTKEYANEYFQNTVGTVQYSLVSGKLPAGMTLNTKRGVIKGIPTTAGSYTFTIQAKDELGRSAKAKVTYNIYDETVLMVSDASAYVRLDDYVEARLADTTTNVPGQTVYESVPIHPYGGSGKYTFTLATPDIANVRLSTDIKDAAGQVTKQNAETANLYLPFEMTEGEHTYSVTVTDAQNPNLTQTINIKVTATKYYNVSGTAKDIFGSNLTGNEIYFYPAGSTYAESYVRKFTYTKETYSSRNEYYTNYMDYTSKAGSDSTSTTVGTQVGTYAAELPAGEYIVKINSEADGIRYQMNEKVKVTADGMHPVTVPIRFYSVSAVATYANGNAIANTKVYFEMKDRQYETTESSDMNFSVTTDANGSFIASLPSNKYAAYIIDSDGNRQYFTTDVQVKDADVNLTEFKVAIERYIVEGVASKIYSDSEQPVVMKNTTLRIYNDKGSYSEVVTTETGAFKVGLPGNATYTVKASIDGVWHTIGTIAVTNANVTGQNLVYNIKTETANATPIALGKDTPFTVSGSGVVIAKFDCTESGYYSMTANGPYVDYMSMYIFSQNADYPMQHSESDYYKGTSMTTVQNVYMTKGNAYYIMFVPENTSTENSRRSIAPGTYTLKIMQTRKDYDDNYSDVNNDYSSSYDDEQ